VGVLQLATVAPEKNDGKDIILVKVFKRPCIFRIFNNESEFLISGCKFVLKITILNGIAKQKLFYSSF